MTNHSELMTSDRVAVVAVHGIANQRPGQTVREVARLLCHGADRAPRYVQGEIHDVLVPVEKLEPGDGLQRDAEQSARQQSARRQPGAPSGFYQAQQPGQELKRHDPEPPDLGIELNDYLLDRLVLPEDDALYESTRISLRRRADDRAVDIYWGDLSRLGTGGLSVLSSLYQLLFHLSTLAADVVDQVALSANGGNARRLLQRLHAWMAWLMKAPAALLQLAMLLMVVFGAVALVAPELRGQLLAAAFALGSIVLAALAALAWLRVTPGAGRWALLFLLLAAALGSMAAALFALITDTWMHLMRNVPVPVTAVESVKLDGRIRIKPAIYTALQLGLNVNLLNARAGPQPYLLGQVHGCGAAMAAQSTAGTSSAAELYALAADLDWGIELRAEALAGGQKVAKKTWSLKEEHIFFKDMVNSTAFVPVIAGANQPSLGQPAIYTMKMPTCYLYPDTMNYRVQWSGGANANTGAVNSGGRRGMAPLLKAVGSNAPSTCNVTSAQASCKGAPMNDTVIYLAWPAAGNYKLTVTPREDGHGRKFDASRTAELSIDVQP